MTNVTITIRAKSEDYHPVHDLHDLLRTMIPYYLDNVEVSHVYENEGEKITVGPRRDTE